MPSKLQIEAIRQNANEIEYTVMKSRMGRKTKRRFMKHVRALRKLCKEHKGKGRDKLRTL